MNQKEKNEKKESACHQSSQNESWASITKDDELTYQASIVGVLGAACWVRDQFSRESVQGERASDRQTAASTARLSVTTHGGRVTPPSSLVESVVRTRHWSPSGESDL